MNAITQATGAGAAQSTLPAPDLQKLLDGAVKGMDDALLKAVEANRVALQQFVDKGIDLRETQLNKALSDLEKMEDTLLAAVRKGATSAKGPLEAAWAPVLDKLQLKGSMAGAQAADAVGQIESQLEQMQTAMRQGRAATLRAAQTMMDGYASLVSGVLIGLSDALQQGGGASAAPAQPARKAARKRS
jgi:AcrR family transcriptional regulator